MRDMSHAPETLLAVELQCAKICRFVGLQPIESRPGLVYVFPVVLDRGAPLNGRIGDRQLVFQVLQFHNS